MTAMAEPTSPKTLTIDGTRQLSKLSAERMERQSSKHGMDCRPPSLRMTALTMERSISNLSQLPGLRKPFRIDLLRAEFRQIGYIRLAEQKFAARVSGRLIVHFEFLETETNQLSIIGLVKPSINLNTGSKDCNENIAILINHH